MNMNTENDNHLSHKIIRFIEKSEKFQDLFEEITVPRKTTLLCEGEISQKIFFVKNGALRLWANNNGEDTTFRFCFENEVASSFLGNEPSLFSIEAIEPSTIIVLKTSDFKMLLNAMPEQKRRIYKSTNQTIERIRQTFSFAYHKKSRRALH